MSYAPVPHDDSSTDKTVNERQIMEVASTSTRDKGKTLSPLLTGDVEITVPASPTSPILQRGPPMPIPSNRFIRLLGMPSGPSTTVPPTEQDYAPYKPNPAMKGLRGGHDGTLDVVDIVDAQNEDPFSLEPLESLLRLHAEKGKDFVIARVTTVDPNDESRFYYSYYAAHHINKVLFRTQPEEGLLHRMKARNPLNNMIIVGDVFYYVIKAKSINVEALTKLDEYNLAKESEEQNATSSSSDFNSDEPKSPIRKSLEALVAAVKTIGNPTSGTEDNRAGRRMSRLVPRERHKTTPSGIRLGTPVSPNSLKSNIRNLFGLKESDSNGHQRRHTIRLVMKPEALRDTHVVQSAHNTDLNDHDVPRLTIPQSTGRRISLDDSMMSRTTTYQDRMTRTKLRLESPVIITDIPSTPIENDNVLVSPTKMSTKKRATHQRTGSSEAPLLELDHMESRPISIDTRTALAVPKPRVRSVSWSNEAQGGMSFAEWVRQHSSQPLATIPGSASSLKSNHRLLINATYPPPKQELIKEGDYYYEAYFFATDDDFLMKSSVRAFFREHALDPSDAVLFSIPTSSDTNVNTDGLAQHPALMDFLYAIEEEELGPWRRSRLFRWFAVLYIALSLIFISVFVPSQYRLPAGFLLLFFLTVLLVIWI